MSVVADALPPASPAEATFGGRPTARFGGLELAAAGTAALTSPRVGVETTRVLSVLGAWQAADRSPGPIALDSAVVVMALLAVGVRPAALPLAALAAVAAGLTFGVHRHRSVLETQGVRWYLGPAALTAAVVGVALLPMRRPDAAAAAAIATLVALVACRTVLWILLGHARRHGHGLTPTLIIGPPDRVAQLRRRLEIFPDAGLYPAGGFTPGPVAPPDGPLEAVEQLAMRHDAVQVLIVADRLPEEVVRDVARYAGPQVDCAVVPPVGALCGVRVRHRIGDLGVIPVFTRPSWGNERVKRLVDVLVAATALALFMPVLALSALAVRRHDHGPALFRQHRVGRDGELFTVIKFRTMDLDAEERKESLRAANVVGGLLFKLGCDPRVTPIGDVLRRTAIDELPQLLNVLRGDMSLVGPRPLPAVPEDFDSLAQIRHEVSPGMTGLWQVRGGNALPYSEMLDLDLAYVLGRSLGLDLKIMLQTIPALLVRRSVY